MWLKKIINKSIWEGRYFDLWSIAHFSTGATWGFMPFLLGIYLYQSVLLFLLLTVLWEFVEYHKGVNEPIGNQLADVFCGFLGMFACHYVLSLYSPSAFVSLVGWFVVVGVLTLFINGASWMVYHRYSSIR